LGISSFNLSYFLFPPFEDEPVLLGELFERPPPDGLPVVLGAFFNPLDFAIALNFRLKKRFTYF
jgi:hypothetical protein